MTELDQTMETNILNVYNAASDAIKAEGMSWYDEANQYAISLDPARFHRAAGIIAALSPLSGWKNNKAKAAQLYRQNGIIQWNGTKNGIGLSGSVKKAVRIFNGEDALDVLVRPKTRAFFMTIVDPCGDHSVVIDRHAFDIATGHVTSDKARSILGRKGEYDRFSSAYCNTAKNVGIAPAQLQAVTWCEWRNRLGIQWR